MSAFAVRRDKIHPSAIIALPDIRLPCQQRPPRAHNCHQLPFSRTAGLTTPQIPLSYTEQKWNSHVTTHDSFLKTSDLGDLLDFTPVPRPNPRHDGWSAARQRAFIDFLAQIGAVSLAAKAVGVSRQSAYNLRAAEGAESFAAAWDRALNIGEDNTVAVGITRAIDGERVPLMYRGKQVGERIRYDDTVMVAALRAVHARHAGRRN